MTTTIIDDTKTKASTLDIVLETLKKGVSSKKLAELDRYDAMTFTDAAREVNRKESNHVNHKEAGSTNK